ncbi:MAG TPA: beta-propeller fold lactonase family protein [Terriglobales bacterium]|nr:beta-propeller fold lactonase family protein [Terriglobales bacterium]
MLRLEKFIGFIVLLSTLVLLTGCAGTSTGRSGTSGGSGSGGSGSGGTQSVPGYGEGTGAAGQTGAAKFLYANPLPGGGPYAVAIQKNGALTVEKGGSADNVNPMTMAIDPSGSFIYQTAQGYNGGTQGGLFVYAIDRSSGSPGPAIASYATGQSFTADVVDNQGKFLYVLGTSSVYAYSIQPGKGTLIPIAGSPFAAAAPSSPGYSQPATLMAVDQTNHFLYASTSKGIFGYAIDQSSGQLTPIAGSPFGGTEVTDAWTIVITPTNSYLYELQTQNSTKIFGYSIDQTSGALTPLAASPFNSGGCGSTTVSGTIGIPGPDNMTIASAGKFMYDNCGVYSIDESTGAISQISAQGPGDWPVISPTGDFLWAVTSNQQACFSCTVGVETYSVDPNTGTFTPMPNSFVLLTDTEVGSVSSLAITK